jgi:hypothetical protein
VTAFAHDDWMTLGRIVVAHGGVIITARDARTVDLVRVRRLELAGLVSSRWVGPAQAWALRPTRAGRRAWKLWLAWQAEEIADAVRAAWARHPA